MLGNLRLWWKRVRAPADQRWYWTPEWQDAERQADEDKAAGRFTEYDSMDDFIASLWDTPGGAGEG